MSMMKKRNSLYIGLILLALTGGILGMFTTSVYGEEAAVQTNGEIVFSTESSGPSPSTSPSETTTSSSGPIKKPAGKYPSTGELVMKSLTISGLVLAAFVVIFYLIKRKKDASEKEG
ncbi:LPXTG-domain-containing protein cell wall anchor domain [Enterococcus moraviensis]|nr:LPXTG-domain-containing protein cell wall anchor domain [Enterococcus moraviensis]